MTKSGLETAQILLQQAEARLNRRDVPTAVTAFNSAEAAGADADRCAGGRWIAHMLGGSFLEAWHESDSIRRRGVPDTHRLWEGENLRGRRVMLRCLHGYGDAVQFLRYVPRLRTRASQVIIEVPPAMVEIAPCFDGVETVITWGAGAPAYAIQWDVQIEVMELPYFFRTEQHELPVAEKYLHLPAGVKRQAAQIMGSSSWPRVGVVWAGGDWNPERSLPLPLLLPLLSTSKCEFWSLQGGRSREEWGALPASPHLRDAACCGDGILPLAAVIVQLDLVITVDTLAAHLAGALGKPAWVLLQYAADWRWMLGRSESLWYPSLRLFRQPEQGDWTSVVACVHQALTNWMAEKAAQQE